MHSSVFTAGFLFTCLAVATSESFLSRFQADLGSGPRHGEIVRDGDAFLLRRTRRLFDVFDGENSENRA